MRRKAIVNIGALLTAVLCLHPSAALHAQDQEVPQVEEMPLVDFNTEEQRLLAEIERRKERIAELKRQLESKKPAGASSADEQSEFDMPIVGDSELQGLKTRVLDLEIVVRELIVRFNALEARLTKKDDKEVKK